MRLLALFLAIVTIIVGLIGHWLADALNAVLIAAVTTRF